MSEVQHQAANRGVTATGATPAIAGTVPARTPLVGTVAFTSDGELAARVFGLLEDGKPPADIVREQQLPPNAVLALTEQWTRLRAAGRPGERPLPEQLRALRGDVEALRQQVGEHLEQLLPYAFSEERSRLEALRQEVQRAVSSLASRVANLEAAVAGHAQRLASLESATSTFDLRLAMSSAMGAVPWR
jgi:hypothetical protein